MNVHSVLQTLLFVLFCCIFASKPQGEMNHTFIDNINNKKFNDVMMYKGCTLALQSVASLEP